MTTPLPWQMCSAGELGASRTYPEPAAGISAPAGRYSGLALMSRQLFSGGAWPQGRLRRVAETVQNWTVAIDRLNGLSHAENYTTRGAARDSTAAHQPLCRRHCIPTRHNREGARRRHPSGHVRGHPRDSQGYSRLSRGGARQATRRTGGAFSASDFRRNERWQPAHLSPTRS